jgi:hypothetical protein
VYVYGLDGLGIEFLWAWSFLHLPIIYLCLTQPPLQ